MNYITFILQTTAWLPTRLFFNIFTHFTVKGVTNLDTIKDKGVIFAMNHASELDPIFFTASLNPFSRFMPMHYVSRESEFYHKNTLLKKILYQEWFFQIWGAYKAKVGMRDYNKSLEKHIKILNNGGSLCIFPEGRKTRDGLLSPVKGGVVHLAMSTGKPIVPVAINGNFKMSPKDFFMRKKTITITFGKPIDSTALFMGEKNVSTTDYTMIANKIVLPIISSIYNITESEIFLP